MSGLAGKRVLVTGAGGFIGSHLTERLVREAGSVRALVRYNSQSMRGWLETSDVANEIEFAFGDIADQDFVRRSCLDVDVVFHLAALIGIPYSYVAPGHYVSVNINGTMNVLQAARDCSIERVIHTSTSETYGTARTVPISEDHPMQGQSPYSATKIGADKIAESFYLSFGTPVVTCRPFNTFGPRQSTRAVIPTIITQCLAGQSVKLGSLDPTRDLNFVTNTVDGFCAAAVAPADKCLGEVFNLSMGEEISIGNLAEKIISLTGADVSVAQDEKRLRPDKSEVERLLGDNSKARETLGWSPRVGLDEGLNLTIDWFRENLSRYRAGEYSV